MPWTVLRPSFRSCQVEPLTCTSCCALPNSHLRAGCQYLRCRIPRQPHFSSAYTPDEFSCMAFHHQAHVCQQSALPIFLWRTYSRINLHCRFIPLWAWLPAPLDIVLDSLSKCVPRARLTLLQRYTLMNFPKWKRLEHEQIEHLYALPVNWKQSLWCNVIWYILRKWTWMSYLLITTYTNYSISLFFKKYMVELYRQCTWPVPQQRLKKSTRKNGLENWVVSCIVKRCTLQNICITCSSAINSI